ncbi:HAD hydrolase family protein [Kytococcus sedentarius]|nr:HAD hydrolase family protein [Kytococcus sedentarius]
MAAPAAGTGSRRGNRARVRPRPAPPVVRPPGITQASALTHLCERLGVPTSEVVAFGDMPNDLPMLGWAGTS